MTKNPIETIIQLKTNGGSIAYVSKISNIGKMSKEKIFEENKKIPEEIMPQENMLKSENND